MEHNAPFFYRLNYVSANISRICPPSSRVSPFCHTAEPFGQGNTRHAHVSQRRLIMPLVALVQKKQSAPATAYKFWCLALASVVAAHRVPSSLIVSACFSPSLMEAFLRRVEDATPYIAVRIIHNCEHSEQYHLPWANITGEANITAEGNITLRSKI